MSTVNTTPAQPALRRCLPIAVLLMSDLAGGAELSGYVILTTDFVFRGVTYSDGDPAAQLGGDVAFDNGLYLGAWASTIDIGSASGTQRDVEVNYYVGYSYDLNDKWTAGANVVAYTFPDAEGSTDYDYFEYSLSANYDDRVWVEYSYSPDLHHTGEATHHVAAFTEWPVFDRFSASAGVGYYDTSNLSGSDYTYWEAGLSRPVWRALVDLRYHDASRWVPFISNPDRADARVSLTVKFGF